MNIITPNEYFDEIYCLNLDRCTDRWNIINDKFKREHIHVKRIEGIDLHTLTDEFEDFKRKNKTTIKRIGRYAVWKSFCKLFEHILNSPSNINKILILEDDVLFHKDFNYLFHLYISKYLDKNWNIWYLGSTQVGSYKYRNLLYESNINTYGTFGIAFKRDMIEKYYKEYKKGILNNDNFWAKSINKKGVFVSNPKLIGHNYGYSENAQYEIKENTHNYFKYNLSLYL